MPLRAPRHEVQAAQDAPRSTGHARSRHGSELVFTYVDQAAFDRASVADEEPASSLRKTVASMGEPFVSGFHPQRLAHELAGVGLELLDDLDDRALVRRYDPQDRNGFRPAGRGHIARARVA